MKKQLFLLGVLALGIPFAHASLDFDLTMLFDKPQEFGYSQNQNISISGFKTEKPEDTTKNFYLQTPILKDGKDIVVAEYQVLLGEVPMSSYTDSKDGKSDELRKQLFALPAYQLPENEDQENIEELDIKITPKLIEMDTTYYGVVVPVDDNVNVGTPSKEFCFNFSKEKYMEGADCENFDGKRIDIQVASEENVDEEHDAAGADMNLADISHSIEGKTITLTWTALDGSENIEIFLFDKEEANYISLGLVSMSAERFEYTYENDNKDEYIFAFIPRNSKGKEVRYNVGVRHETEPVKVEDAQVGPKENILMIAAISFCLFIGYRLYRKRETE